MELEYFKVDGKLMKCTHSFVKKFHEYGGMIMNHNTEAVHYLVIEFMDGQKKEFGGIEGSKPFVEANEYLKNVKDENWFENLNKTQT